MGVEKKIRHSTPKNRVIFTGWDTTLGRIVIDQPKKPNMTAFQQFGDATLGRIAAKSP
ncbi:MAG: hypothetical protein PUB52_10550 [Lachnospiraceae bacterium]|nr:hypothetical protein [Lachnospiraceae bacterium]